MVCRERNRRVEGRWLTELHGEEGGRSARVNRVARRRGHDAFEGQAKESCPYRGRRLGREKTGRMRRDVMG